MVYTNNFEKIGKNKLWLNNLHEVLARVRRCLFSAVCDVIHCDVNVCFACESARTDHENFGGKIVELFIGNKVVLLTARYFRKFRKP